MLFKNSEVEHIYLAPFGFSGYYMTPVPNAENGRYSWWISKKGCIYAHYCFSFNGNLSELDTMLSKETMKSYVEMFETFLSQLNTSSVR